MCSTHCIDSKDFISEIILPTFNMCTTSKMPADQTAAISFDDSANDYVDMPELIQVDMPELIPADNYIGTPLALQNLLAVQNLLGWSRYHIRLQYSRCTPVLQTLQPLALRKLLRWSGYHISKQYCSCHCVVPGHTNEEIDARFSIIFLLQSLSSMQEMD